MRYLFLFFFGVLATSNSAWSAEAEIVWTVDHPFRYLRFASDLDIQRWALTELMKEDSEAGKFAPISHMERKLNNPRWWDADRIKKLKALRRTEGRSDLIDESLRQGWGSFLSSSAIGARGEIDGICWDASNQRHDRCQDSEYHGTTTGPQGTNSAFAAKNGSYLVPRYHRISLRVSADSKVEGDCTWLSDSYVFVDSGNENGPELKEIANTDCSIQIAARVPFDPGDASKSISISVVLPDDTILEDKNVRVTDFMVFAMGDSFSSGEGNPEILAKLDPVRAITPAFPNGEPQPEGRSLKYGIPRRSPADGSSAAIWTDRRCHRSIYSYQTRVAMQLAIAPDPAGNNHHAVTYYQLTCSGAEISEDIAYPWEGRECLSEAYGNQASGENHRFYMPQISKASLELCQNRRSPHAYKRFEKRFAFDEDDFYLSDRKRQTSRDTRFARSCDFRRNRNIGKTPHLWFCPRERRVRSVDLVLNSAGGNDIGFSSVVARAVANSRLLEKLGSFEAGRALRDRFLIGENDVKERLQTLQSRLTLYDTLLTDFLGATSKPGESEDKPVISMLYPNLIFRHSPAGDREYCPANNRTMDVSKLLKVNGEFLPFVEQAVEGKKSDNPNSFDGLVQTIRNKGQEFGWTLVDSHRSEFEAHGFCAISNQNPNESGKGKAEEQGIPFKLVDLSKKSNEEVYANEWMRFHPVDEFFPYETRQSWFRTPNQDYLTTSYFKGKMPRGWDEEKEESSLFLASRIKGGSFHPTAEGHAHIADHVYCHAREKLFEGFECDPEKVKANEHRWSNMPRDD